MYKISKLFSTLFFLGYVKIAPGTIGTFFSIILITYIYRLTNNLIFISIFIILFLLSIKFIQIYTKCIDDKDTNEIIIDEFLGVYLIIFFSENYISINNIYETILIFILFRFFDIAKPYPINLIDKKMKNAFGVIFDDIIAGAYSIIVLFIIDGFL